MNQANIPAEGCPVTEEATARLTRAKAEELERKLAHEAKQEGTV